MNGYEQGLINNIMTEQYNQICDWHKVVAEQLWLRNWIEEYNKANPLPDVPFVNMCGPKTSSHYYLLDMSKQGFSMKPKDCGIIRPPITA